MTNLATSLVARTYSASRDAAAPQPGSGQGLASLGRDFAATVEDGERVAMASMTSNADPHALVQALAQTELAIETAVTVRNKVVEAYQELLRMPI